MVSEARRRLSDGESICVNQLVLAQVHESWAFAEQHQQEIKEHWAQATKRNPLIFNGTVYLLVDHAIEADRFIGEYAEGDFASYLYWREQGFRDPLTCDGFASVLLRSSADRFLFTKAAAYTLNAGLWVPAGGMIDQRDVGAQGQIDVWQYGLRELAEETGLSACDVVAEPEFPIARDGALIAYGLLAQARVSEDEVIARFVEHSSKLEDMPELDEVRWFSVDEALQHALVPRFVKLLLGAYAMRHNR